MDFLFLCLGYFIPLIICLLVNNIVNWDYTETIGDILFPKYDVTEKLQVDIWKLYWFPIINIGVSLSYLFLIVKSIISYISKKIGIYYILNIKIKNKKK